MKKSLPILHVDGSLTEYVDKKGVLLEKKDKISANNEYWLPRPYDFFAGVTAGFCKK